jgi:hypothetical protein
MKDLQRCHHSSHEQSTRRKTTHLFRSSPWSRPYRLPESSSGTKAPRYHPHRGRCHSERQQSHLRHMRCGFHKVATAPYYQVCQAFYSVTTFFRTDIINFVQIIFKPYLFGLTRRFLQDLIGIILRPSLDDGESTIFRTPKLDHPKNRSDQARQDRGDFMQVKSEEKFHLLGFNSK